jgi:hypothetical protein
MRNPVVVLTALTKHTAHNTLNYFKGLTGFISAGAVGDVNESVSEALSHIQPRDLDSDCFQIPALYVSPFSIFISSLTFACPRSRLAIQEEAPLLPKK